MAAKYQPTPIRDLKHEGTILDKFLRKALGFEEGQ